MVLFTFWFLASPLFVHTCLALDSINFGTFGNSATYSVANQLGFFTNQNLAVNTLTIPNSTYGYQQLLKGAYDILTGTIDNAVGLHFNDGSDLTILGQVDSGSGMVLASVHNITTPQQLKGKPLMVDAANSGYAYALQKVLSLYGLRLANGDFSFQVIGASRYAPLVTGQLPDGEPTYGTIINGVNTAQLNALPESSTKPNILANVSDFIWPYATTSFTITTPVLANATKVTLITRLITAFYEASVYLADPFNKHCSIAAIATQLNVSTEVATLEYAQATDPIAGETHWPGGNNFTVNRQGLLNVLDIRQQFGGFANNLSSFDFADAIVPGTGKFIDYSIRDRAVAAASNYCPKCN